MRPRVVVYAAGNQMVTLTASADTSTLSQFEQYLWRLCGEILSVKKGFWVNWLVNRQSTVISYLLLI
ncbi:hypothetical protein VIS19158_13582 [Vibrio scophthalmi LMG 19158]|uniref:Uncharacterized protein n=1 Tax=Vibrio scophthalmi LMG 19158 TaxID=870967 RepID=F9RTP6_9VIBR|nr:hypothetical protein VIS19158_13582 [Vibrio scophthalmi LMG 19158]